MALGLLSLLARLAEAPASSAAVRRAVRAAAPKLGEELELPSGRGVEVGGWAIWMFSTRSNTSKVGGVAVLMFSTTT